LMVVFFKIIEKLFAYFIASHDLLHF